MFKQMHECNKCAKYINNKGTLHLKLYPCKFRDQYCCLKHSASHLPSPPFIYRSPVNCTNDKMVPRNDENQTATTGRVVPKLDLLNIS